MSFRDTLKLFSIVALMVAAPSIVCADTESDRRIVASKAYVDTKQPIQIGAAGPNSTDAGKLVVVDTSGQIAMGGTLESNIQSPIPAETSGQIATHSGTAGTFGTPLTKTISIDASVNTDDGYIPTVGAVEGYAQQKDTTASAGEIGVFNSTGSTVDSNKSFDTANGTISTTDNAGLVPTSAQVKGYVEGYAVAKAQSTGYQVLTTGTGGTVTTEYLKVPIATGTPSANVTPTGLAQVWLEQTN